MTAFENKSEITLVVEGARGPPGHEIMNLFCSLFNTIIHKLKLSQNKRNLRMPIPRIYNMKGFKNPPVLALDGRGPPGHEKTCLFA